MYVSYNLISSHGLSLHGLSHIYHIRLEIDNIVSIVMIKRETEKSTQAVFIFNTTIKVH